MKKKIICKTGLEEVAINKETFDSEIALCKVLSKENNGKCSWGICENCGVIPLLYKLHKGQLLEESEEIAKIRNEILRFKKQ